ncbi:type II toxin-antitoxin system RelE/ParE family toxin [Flavobacterium sp. K5-23]|uniref:type II toxin-antitoxin system RelE/ParE family toxin n=1 Tax=Flavobacterium sp. K5-23 TaxID=2746225 RepID=UPI00200E3B30|nr:type II toxin-antitoxin system RelE/ParE family toxin [Flavobacterium sp. K5-23]UQD56537.1 type II toxin-antitoxin system RelE/ParE family toxin [Flavobacterium sp. K5-23]
MSEYIISEKALEDINNIWIYTAENWSVEQANRYYNLIIDEIEYIVDNFEMGRDFGKIKKSYKYSKVKSHLIFFRKDKTNVIEVVRVLCERMDIENRLAE